MQSCNLSLTTSYRTGVGSAVDENRNIAAFGKLSCTCYKNTGLNPSKYSYECSTYFCPSVHLSVGAVGQSTRPARRPVGVVVTSVGRNDISIGHPARSFRRSVGALVPSVWSIRRSVGVVGSLVNRRGRYVCRRGRSAGQSTRSVRQSADVVGPPISRRGRSVGR